MKKTQRLVFSGHSSASSISLQLTFTLTLSTRDSFHSLAEARSWALHREVAFRLASRPELLDRAKRRVEVWQTKPDEHPYAATWNQLLNEPLSRLQEALVDRGARMCALRQASPFAGALDAPARWKILKQAELRPREAS